MHRKLDDVVYNTLLELYLGEIGTCRKEERYTKEMRALELLKRAEVWEWWFVVNGKVNLYHENSVISLLEF